MSVMLFVVFMWFAGSDSVDLVFLCGMSEDLFFSVPVAYITMQCYKTIKLAIINLWLRYKYSCAQRAAIIKISL
jgi:hypothetical protein